MVKGSFKGVTKKFQGYFEHFQGNLKEKIGLGASMMSQDCFKEV